MGNTISLIRLAYTDFLDSLRRYKDLQERIKLSPGLPVLNPTDAFWTFPPSPVSKHVSELPAYADFVVIGSGITGTSFARTLLDRYHSKGIHKTLVILEARDACSGATGRNGGHICPPLYHDYTKLAEEYGEAAAQQMIRFRLAHLHEIRRAADEEDVLKESQWREVETVDVFYDQSLFDKAKIKLQTFKASMPNEASHHRALSSRNAIQAFRLASDVVGCITCYAGAVHPFRFVTGVLANLLSRYPEQFFLCTNTPCVSISEPTKATSLYTVRTPRGTIVTPHVIHATNGWCAHLLKPMRTKIIPVRENMSAQRPGENVAPTTHMGYRSFIFYNRPVGFDYLTQLPDGENELMLGTGGGFALEGEEGILEVANADDGVYNKNIAAHISGSLPRYFGEYNWGAEKDPEEEDEGEGDDDDDSWFDGRVKALWSGILGFSADSQPWVGSLPPKVSGRGRPPVSSTPCIGKGNQVQSAAVTAAPGEWIAAGYSGEGMVHAWMCGKALAHMVMGSEAEAGLSEWFPDMMRVTEKRWREAKAEKLLKTFQK